MVGGHSVLQTQFLVYFICDILFHRYVENIHADRTNFAFTLMKADDLKIIPDSRIRNIISKGPKYRFFSNIDFNKCRDEIAAALNEFGNR